MDLARIEPLLESPDTDKRIQALHQLQQLLQESEEINEVERFVPVIKSSLRHANSYLSTAALSCLPSLFPRLIPSSESQLALTSSHSAAAHHAHTLKQAFIALLPLDKLADSKTQVRESAREAIVSAARTALKLGVYAGTGPSKDKEGPWQYWEARVQEQAFHSKSAKAREQALHALVALRDPAHPPIAPLRPFTAFLLPLLSDPDPTVRTLALSATIRIFGSDSVTPAARADLKKAMIKADVGKKTQETILAAVLGGGSIERTQSGTSLASFGSGATASASAAQHAALSDGGKSDRSATRLSSSPPARSPPLVKPVGALKRPGPPPTGASLAASLPSTAFPSDPSSVHAPPSEIHPVYMASDRDVLHALDSMKDCFEGKETEHNWMERDRNVARIRGMVKGNTPQQYLDSFLIGLKIVLEGILKTASSLRTTVAVSALALITELAQTLRHSLDHFLEHFMSHCLCMAGGTKKLVASASQGAVTALITHLGYHHKMLQLLWVAMNDKIASARTFVAQHVATFVEVHGVRSKHAIAATGGLDELEKILKKGLQDPTLAVKETMRKTFWELKAIWPKLTDRIVAGIDTTTRKQLEKSDPSKKGPEKPVTAKAGRPSMRDLVKQAKQAKDAAPGLAETEMLVSSPPNTAASRPDLPQGPPSRIAVTSPHRSVPVPTSPVSATSTPSRPTTVRAPSSTGSRRHSRIPIHSPIHSPTHPPTDLHHAPTPTPLSTRRKSSREEDDSDSLFKATSPFQVDDRDVSLDFAAARTGSRGPSEMSSRRGGDAPTTTRTMGGDLVLPVTEPIVDDALRDQAAQAEQAAQRLLELADEEDDVSTTALSMAVPGVDEVRRTPLMPRQVDVFADSPDPRSGEGSTTMAATNGSANGAKNWWMKKADQQASSPARPVDSPERTREIDALISSFTSGQASPSDIRKLCQLSKERPILELDDPLGGDGDSPLSSPSHRSSSSSSFWAEHHRFPLIWESLSRQLLVTSLDEETKEPLLVLFKNLIEYQLASFAGSEKSVFSLLLHLRASDPSRSTIGAVEGISTTFCGSSEPLFSLSSLNQALVEFRSPTTSSSSGSGHSFAFALGLRSFGQVFERLPAEVLEDVLPRSLGLIKKGLDDSSGEVRRAGIGALTSVYKVLRDEARLFELVGEMPRDRKNLLTYYIARLHPAEA